MKELPSLKVKALNLQCNGVAQNGGTRYEIPFTLPGEVLTPHIVQKRGKTTFALPEKLSKRSADRIRPDCRHFGTCGGCHLRHVSYAASLLIKKKIFVDTLQSLNRNGVFDKIIDTLKIIPAQNPLHYRNTARFYRKDGILSQHAMLTHSSFEIEECLTISKNTWNLAQKVHAVLPESISEIEIKENEQGNTLCILSGTLSTPLPPLPAESTYLFDKEKRIYTHLSGEKTLTHILSINTQKFHFEMGPDSFFQVHSAMAELLYKTVAEQVPSHGLLYDLFAGTGTIGIIMAKMFPDLKVKSIEKKDEMVELSKKNALLNHVENIEFTAQDIFAYQITESPDCIIIDPPRNGLEKETAEHITTLGSKRIMYISCNPQTFLRDMQHILQRYKLMHITLFDMMPYTSHMEVLAVFDKL